MFVEQGKPIIFKLIHSHSKENCMRSKQEEAQKTRATSFLRAQMRGTQIFRTTKRAFSEVNQKKGKWGGEKLRQSGFDSEPSIGERVLTRRKLWRRRRRRLCAIRRSRLARATVISSTSARVLMGWSCAFVVFDVLLSITASLQIRNG